ncbi:hypothetical protein TNCV_1686291 [Trichonephila clavipes]|nr:hypothetical protein TNCV_1686291 [Trichonephila clavipes]
MVWGAISYHGRSTLLRIEGNPNSNSFSTPAPMGLKHFTARALNFLDSPLGSDARLICRELKRPPVGVVFYSKDNLVALHFKYDQARHRFVEWAQDEIAVVPDFHKRILFSDEAHFWLNGYVNKQNCRIWSEANPQVYVETPLHPEKLTVWCALWAGGILFQKR